MRDLLRSASGQWLSLAEYDADFCRTVESIDVPILKTERKHSFRKFVSPDWEAIDAGRWEAALWIAAKPTPSYSQRESHPTP